MPSSRPMRSAVLRDLRRRERSDFGWSILMGVICSTVGKAAAPDVCRYLHIWHRRSQHTTNRPTTALTRDATIGSCRDDRCRTR
jgi:hypothetical protein